MKNSWLFCLLRSSMTLASKVVGTYLWFKSGCGMSETCVTMPELRYATRIADTNVRLSIKALERYGWIVVNHKHYSSDYHITLKEKV